MRTAVNTQYAWGYNEPPRWHYPTSNCLGEMLLNLKRFEEAEDVFRDEIENRYLKKKYDISSLWIKVLNSQSSERKFCSLDYRPIITKGFHCVILDSKYVNVGDSKYVYSGNPFILDAKSLEILFIFNHIIRCVKYVKLCLIKLMQF